MTIIEILLLAYFVVMPIYEWFNGSKTKHQIRTGKLSRERCYQQTILFLWLPTLLLFALIWTSDLTLIDLGLSREVGGHQIIAYCLLAIVLAYFVFSLWSTSKDAVSKQKAKQQMTDLAWLLPENSKELGWFVFGVSFTAGVCEELLFRGFLIHYLEGLLGLPAAVLISSVLFGLCHVYQGWQNVVRTGLVGLTLALIYLWSGSLILVMVLHFAIDAYAGALYFICRNEDTINPGEQAA